MIYVVLACCVLASGAGVLLYRTMRAQTARPEATAVETRDLRPPRRQPGVPAPFVYNAATPWGWLEYRNGNFLGQELALKRAIISLGRESDNEIELDGDTVSRYHAELAWQNGQIIVTDNQSLNGVLLNGRRVRGSTLIRHGDMLEVGVHRFLLKCASAPLAGGDTDDPLLKHLRKPTARNGAEPHPAYAQGPQRASSPAAPTRALTPQPAAPIPSDAGELDIAWQETLEMAGQPPADASAAPAPFSTEPPLNLPGPLRLPSRKIP